MTLTPTAKRMKKKTFATIRATNASATNYSVKSAMYSEKKVKVSEKDS